MHICTSVCVCLAGRECVCVGGGRLELSLIVCNKELTPLGSIAALSIIWETTIEQTHTHGKAQRACFCDCVFIINS